MDAARLVRSFPAVAARDARVLILGSMPGRRSLEAGEYYALPQNSFWRIMETLFGVPRGAGYTRRLACLKKHRLALWDVLHSCERHGSLDSAIIERTVVTNDFASFLHRHRDISRVFFNGAKAEQFFRRRVLPGLAAEFPSLDYARLPSTSPAHAGMTYTQKLAYWSRVGRAVSGE